MIKQLHIYQRSMLNIGGFTINLVPFLLFLLLVQRNGNTITNIEPFALFYSFRRTTLFMFRGNPNNNSRFGWIGLTAAFLGYAIGLFGQFNNIFWDIAAVGAGVGAACFPSVQKEFSLENPLPSDSGNKLINLLLWFIPIILIIGVLVLTARSTPYISFLIMLIYWYIAYLGFLWDPNRIPNSSRIHVRVPNVFLSILLFLSVLLVRVSRSLGIGTPAELGIALLAIVLFGMTLDIILGKPKHSTITPEIRLQLMVFGTCADFCAIFSAIYIGVTFGMSVYMWIIVAYACGFIFGQPMLKMLKRLFPQTSVLTISLLGIALGLLLTFILPLYFVGIFFIRAFASVLNQNAIKQYHHTNLTGRDNVYMVSYRLIAIAGLTTQLVLWLSLIGTMHLKSQSFNNILAAFTFHRTTSSFGFPIFITHIILVVFMLIFLYVVNKANHGKSQE